MSDVGFTHVALTVSDMEKSIAFYGKYAGMTVVHRRQDPKNNSDVAWIGDLTRSFVIVLMQVNQVKNTLLPACHLGVACNTREDIDRFCEQAKLEGVLLDGPHDWGTPVGYWVFIRDPDGHTLELSYGQEISFIVENARKQLC
ncbi:VOC family protein [Calothrix rhizosoleniae]|uniref:VOC family protein n=1 Tax=Calothrix rhizosoleniae TaxID=888997 RepID=UPI000B49FCD5|nr:VOC family protein [Calothrix rhizosoleniae]